jgi:osmotically-inducible protein OsmY
LSFGTIRVALLLGSALSLSGCVSTVIGAAAAGGVAASQERGFSQGVTDNRIALDINRRWADRSSEILAKLSTEVHEGRVLVTGTLPSLELKLDAIKLAWQVDGVREVIDEVKVGESDRFGSSARDLIISSDIRSSILLDKEILSVNYTIETVDGTVYLIGVAQNQAELDRVIAYARNVRYVRNVVSYVRLKSDPLPPMPEKPAS